MGGERFVRDPLAFAGRVETPVHESLALAGNPLGDPARREVPIYLPPGHDAPGARFPLVVLLAGFTGRGQNFLETHPWKRGVVARFDQAVARGECPPAILALPDAFTRLGGSQYVNSAAVGRYEDYLADELVPFVEARYPVLPGRRAVVGKSSGGFGALHLSLRRPGLFAAAASISGDCAFEYAYASEFLAAARGLLAHGSDPAAFLRAFEQVPELGGDGHAVLNLLAMSACYSPAPGTALGFELPIDPSTGERVEAVWERWLAFDPLRRVASEGAAWRTLELLHLEAGRRDEFHLQFALRLLVRELERHGIPHRHVEFNGGHFGLDGRYLAVLPTVIATLAAGA